MSDELGRVVVSILEGGTVRSSPPVWRSDIPDPRDIPLRGAASSISLDDVTLSKHLLFLGGIGTGKTNAMMQILDQLRKPPHTDNDDAIVVFDSKGDFLREYYREGDLVLGPRGGSIEGGVVWNLFSDLQQPEGFSASDGVYEMATTIFGDELDRAGDNFFFAAGGRDLLAGMIEALQRDGKPHDNCDLRTSLEMSSKAMWDMLRSHPDLAGAAQYLDGAGNTPNSIRAFLQQSVNKAFSGVFREKGDFSIREFVRSRGSKVLFIEYDIAVGSRLLPVYKILIDTALKQALEDGRAGRPGRVFFIMDEFALLPQLSHISDGINFGRSLGLRFMVGSQNMDQVIHAYGPELARTILSGFGSVFAFRLMDAASRALIQERFGRNRKQISVESPVRAQGVTQQIVDGYVLEDWSLSNLTIGQCIVSLPVGLPFLFQFQERKL